MGRCKKNLCLFCPDFYYLLMTKLKEKSTWRLLFVQIAVDPFCSKSLHDAVLWVFLFFKQAIINLAVSFWDYIVELPSTQDREFVSPWIIRKLLYLNTGMPSGLQKSVQFPFHDAFHLSQIDYCPPQYLIILSETSVSSTQVFLLLGSTWRSNVVYTFLLLLV